MTPAHRSLCVCALHQGPPTQDSVVTLLSIFRSLKVGGLQRVCAGIFLERNLLTFQFCLVPVSPWHHQEPRRHTGQTCPPPHGFDRGSSLSHKRRCRHPVGSEFPPLSCPPVPFAGSSFVGSSVVGS